MVRIFWDFSVNFLSPIRLASISSVFAVFIPTKPTINSDVKNNLPTNTTQLLIQNVKSKNYILEINFKKNEEKTTSHKSHLH